MTQSRRRPVLLHVHGGAWMMGHKSHQGQPLLHRMVELGWVGVLSITGWPRDAYPAQIIDVKKAIAWVKTHIEEYGGDPDFVIVTGGSAGDIFLAGLTSGHADWQVGLRVWIQRCKACWQCIRLWISPTDTAFGSKREWMDLSAERSSSRPEKRHRRCSRTARPSPGSIAKVSPSQPPVFYRSGTHDSLVWVEEVRRFVAEFAPTSVPLVTQSRHAQHAFEIFHSPRTSHFLNAASAWLSGCARSMLKIRASGDRSEPPTADRTGAHMIDAWIQHPTARHLAIRCSTHCVAGRHRILTPCRPLPTPSPL